MRDPVEETRALWRRAAFAWGRLDCCLAVCDHVRRVTGVDPAAPWRGSYEDEEGARIVAAPYGGVLGILDHMLTRAGLARGEPAHGRPVVARIGGQEVAGLMFGTRVGVLAADRGLVEGRAPVLAAWVLP